ncbi:MAG: hypothetical protein U0350_28380 [Caldilineaceae bacterium]
MSTYRPSELLQQWTQGNLTTEQAIGHVLQNLLMLAQHLTELEKRLRQLEQPPLPPKA